MYFRSMTAMFDLPVTSTSETIHTSIIMLLDPENVGLAVGILLLSYIYKLILTLHMYFRFLAAMSDLPVTATSESINISATVLLVPKNVGVAVGISFLSYKQAEIYDIAIA